MDFAAEALLVFGLSFDGLQYRDGEWTVTYARGSELVKVVLSDFGYRPAQGGGRR